MPFYAVAVEFHKQLSLINYVAIVKPKCEINLRIRIYMLGMRIENLFFPRRIPEEVKIKGNYKCSFNRIHMAKINHDSLLI